MWRVDFPVNTKLHTTQHYLRLILWAAVALVLTVTQARATSRAATLEAIHQLENPRDLPTAGPRGELGAYQFRVQTWRMHTAEPFTNALERSASDAVAVKHYEWLRTNLESAGRPATPYTIGLAWNGGLEAAIRGSSPRAAREYAQRVANLTAELDRAPAIAAALPADVSPVVAVPMTSVIAEPFAVRLPSRTPLPALLVRSSPFVVALR